MSVRQKAVAVRRFAAYNRGYDSVYKKLRAKGVPIPVEYRKYYSAGAKAARDGVQFVDGYKTFDAENSHQEMMAEIEHMKLAGGVVEQEDEFVVDDSMYDPADMDDADDDEADQDDADLDDADQDEADYDLDAEDDDEQ